jgi:hypothetical protein
MAEAGTSDRSNAPTSRAKDGLRPAPKEVSGDDQIPNFLDKGAVAPPDFPNDAAFRPMIDVTSGLHSLPQEGRAPDWRAHQVAVLPQRRSDPSAIPIDAGKPKHFAIDEEPAVPAIRVDMDLASADQDHGRSMIAMAVSDKAMETVVSQSERPFEGGAFSVPFQFLIGNSRTDPDSAPIVTSSPVLVVAPPILVSSGWHDRTEIRPETPDAAQLAPAMAFSARVATDMPVPHAVPAMVPVHFRPNDLSGLPESETVEAGPVSADLAEMAVPRPAMGAKESTRPAVTRVLGEGDGAAMEPESPGYPETMSGGALPLRGPSAESTNVQRFGPAASISNQVLAPVLNATSVSKTGADKVELILAPEELGRVRVDFDASGDAMRVVLTAEQPDTLALLRRHSDQLILELRQAGYAQPTLSFGQWGASSQGQSAHVPSPSPGPRPEMTVPSSDPLPPRRAVPGGAGLDLRF